MKFLLMFAFAAALGQEMPRIDLVRSLLAHPVEAPLTIGSTYRFRGVLSSNGEISFRPLPQRLKGPKGCLSALTGMSSDQNFYERHRGKIVEFTAVVAAWEDAKIVGANDQLKGRDLTGFENFCYNDVVLVLTNP